MRDDPVPAAVRARNRRSRSQDHLAWVLSLQLQRAGAGARLFTADEPGAIFQIWREVQQLLRTQLGHDLVDLEKMPETIGEQANPFVRAGRHASRQRCLSDRRSAAIGNLLRGEAIGVDAQDRPQETQASCRSWRDSIHHRRPIATTWCGRRCPDRREAQGLCQARRRQHVRVAGIPRLLYRHGDRPAKLPPDASQPVRRRSDDRGGELRADVSRPLLLHPRGLRRRRSGAVRAGLAQLQDVIRYALEHGCDVFDFTIGDEPYKREWCDAEIRLCDYVSAVSLRGWLATRRPCCFVSSSAHQAQSDGLGVRP